MTDRIDWWLATMSPDGSPHTLIDGPHPSKEDVEKAVLHVQAVFGLDPSKFCCVETRTTSLKQMGE